MNISNVVLDRDKQIVTFNDDAGVEYIYEIEWRRAPISAWRVMCTSCYSMEVNKYLKGLAYSGASPTPILSPLYESKPDQEPTPDYYNHEYKGLTLDPYRICKIYSVVNPCQQHAIKKLLRGLNKGDVETPLELIESVEGILARWKEMIKEDAE